MTRNLKALGLALAASFAMTVLAAPAAQAAPEFWTGESAIIKLTPDVLGQNLVTKVKGIETITCNELTALGELPKPEQTLTSYNVTYSGCDANAGKNPVTVDENACEYWYTVKSALGGEEFGGEVHIFCPTENGIEFAVHSAVPTETICTFTVVEQTVTGVTYKNIETTGGPKILTVTVDGKVQTKYSGPACGNGETNGIEFTGNQLWHAENTSSKAIDLKVKNTP